jgi:glutamate-1-semialdehyde 2,1-aminomutase
VSVVAIVQARSSSSRLPKKVMRDINGSSLISILLRRLNQAKRIDKLVLATTTSNADNLLVTHVKSLGFDVFRGSENDVLTRYYQAARKFKAKYVIRITGDCPLVDASLVDSLIEKFFEKKLDYISNSNPPTFPDGLDVEMFTLETLERTQKQAKKKFDREHVTPFIRDSGLFRTFCICNDDDLSTHRWTVDEKADLEVIKGIFRHFSPDIFFDWQKVLKLYEENPQFFDENISIKRNEGASMDNGQKLWKRAKSVIPGGNMLLSKRPEMFLPTKWPTYFSKAKGCMVWDLEGNEFIDMSIMGIGTNILGYGNDAVDAAVLDTVKKGNMSTLNCPEEVYLAEKLVELHPWADMVRLCRSGGEANSIAIRIARASSRKDNVAICGYHGWHDWYLSVNIADDKGLDGHLLPGLESNGVPRNLKGTVFPFKYNDIDELTKLIEINDIGIIKMEVSRNTGPKDNFLQKVRALASKKNIILIFDECTSGFRQSLGGLHKIYNVEPDMAMFGKALGNGYAITAVIGKREIMEAAQSTFISSTFWTERVGPTAALKTLEEMERVKSWDTITNIGLMIRDRLQKLANLHELKIDQWGLPALSGYTFDSANALEYKTYITQEMLKNKFLVGNSIYVCTEHKQEYIDRYFDILEKLFNDIKHFEENEKNIEDYLDGPVCQSGFKRLN